LIVFALAAGGFFFWQSRNARSDAATAGLAAAAAPVWTKHTCADGDAYAPGGFERFDSRRWNR
jgi:hypothetical protein